MLKCNRNDIHNAGLCENYGLRGSNDIHNAACTPVAIIRVVIDIRGDPKSISQFVRQWDIWNGKWPMSDHYNAYNNNCTYTSYCIKKYGSTS